MGCAGSPTASRLKRKPRCACLETYDLKVAHDLKPLQDIEISAVTNEGVIIRFYTQCRIDTPVEVDYYRNGGILHTVLRRLASDS